MNPYQFANACDIMSMITKPKYRVLFMGILRDLNIASDENEEEMVELFNDTYEAMKKERWVSLALDDNEVEEVQLAWIKPGKLLVSTGDNYKEEGR